LHLPPSFLGLLKFIIKGYKMNDISLSQLNNFLEKTSKKDLLLMLQEKQQEIAQLKQSNETWEQIKTAENCIDMKEAAKVLKYPGIGRNKLFAILRSSQLLMSNNQPYQSYIDRGWFHVIEVDKSESFGYGVMISKTMVTPKGLEKIKELLDEFDTDK
jgi:anti-repressor protein